MIDRLKQFVVSEMRSCSMDIGGITSLYVYRMWGGAVAIEDIATAMEEVRRMREENFCEYGYKTFRA
jgi:hypothetical protein